MKIRLLGIGLLGVAAGLFLSFIFRMPFSENLVYDIGPISCISLYLFLRFIGMLLLFYGIVCWVFAKCRIRHFLLIRMPIHRAVFLSALLYSSISSAFVPEVSPLQFVMEKKPSFTMFHPGFSRFRFLKVKSGMTRTEVKNLVGEGFTEDMHLSPDRYSAWSYSKGGMSENYWQYHVVFDDMGKVSTRYMLYWFD